MFILDSHVSIPSINIYELSPLPIVWWHLWQLFASWTCGVPPQYIFLQAYFHPAFLSLFPLGLWTSWAIEIPPLPQNGVLSWSPREIFQISWDQVWSAHEWKSMPLDDQENACRSFVLSFTCEHSKKPAPWHRGWPAKEAGHNHAGPIILDFQPLELSSIYL